MRGSDIGGGFLLPVLRRQVSLIRSGFGVGSGLRFIRNTPSHSTFHASAIKLSPEPLASLVCDLSAYSIGDCLAQHAGGGYPIGHNARQIHADEFVCEGGELRMVSVRIARSLRQFKGHYRVLPRRGQSCRCDERQHRRPQRV